MRKIGIVASGLGTTKAINIDTFFDYLESTKSGGGNTRMDFSEVPWVFRATNMRASAISRIPFRVLNKDGEEAKNWNFPLKQLLYTIEADLCLAGGAFVLKSETLRSLKGLQRLNPWTIIIETDSKEGITGYRQEIQGQDAKDWKPEQLVFFDHFYNPSDDLGLGISPAEVSTTPSSLVRNMNLFANNYFENGAIPAVVLETEHQVKKEQQDATRKMWNRRLQGVRNAWNTIVLQRGLKAHVIGHATKDLAMPELEDSAKKQIAIAFGIPLGILEQEDVSHSTAESHQVTFWTDTIIPEADLIAERLNQSLFSDYDYEFEFNYQELEAVQNIEFKKAQSLSTLLREANNAFLNEILTQDEARRVFEVGFARLGFNEFSDLIKDGVPPEITQPPETNSENSPKVGDRDKDAGTGAGDQNSKKVPLGSAPKKVYRELARWRKSEKIDFESKIIPEWFQKTVRAVADKIGIERSFTFLKQAGARAEYEERLRAVIEPYLEKYRESVVSVIGNAQFTLDAPDPQNLTGMMYEARLYAEEAFQENVEQFSNEIGEIIDEVLYNQVLANSAEIGVAFDPTFVNLEAGREARNMTTELVRMLDESTTRSVLEAVATVQETPGLGLPDLISMLEPAFGSYRAELIAVTETTRALSKSQIVVQEALADSGIEMRRVWETAMDEMVCPICGTLAGRPEEYWRDLYPEGAPAHPNCRCDIALSSLNESYHNRRAEELAEQRQAMLEELEKAREQERLANLPATVPVSAPAFPASNWTEQGFRVEQSQNYRRGVEESYQVRMDDGSRGIAKSNVQSGSAWTPEDGNHARAEVLTYELSEKMGFKLVPETFWVDDLAQAGVPTRSGGGGSVQRWIENTQTYNSLASQQVSIDSVSYRRMRLMDFVSGNTDRHGLNWIVDNTTGEVYAIDNGFSFWEKGANLRADDFLERFARNMNVPYDQTAWNPYGVTKEEFAKAFDMFSDADLQTEIYNTWGQNSVQEFLGRQKELYDYVLGGGQDFADEVMALTAKGKTW